MSVIVPAYAKLNLTLDVLGRRSDGYHEIESVMQTISLHDLIYVAASDCAVIETAGPPITGENLVLKAARELEVHFGRKLSFRIHLIKRIPMGAGLGGGSSDAAAFLKAAISVYRLPVSTEELTKLATAVGQDVPFFLRGGTAYASGRGSSVESLPAFPGSWTFVVVQSPLEVSTRDVYAASDGGPPSSRRSGRFARGLKEGAVEPGLFGNDLEDVTARLFPAVDEVRRKLREILAGVHMTGSGSAFFLAFKNMSEARSARIAIEGLGLKSWLCQPVVGWPA